MTPDGVLSFKVRYNGADRPNLGNIEDFSGIGASLDVQTANAVKVHGVIIKKDEVQYPLWSGGAAGVFVNAFGAAMAHPVSDGDYVTVQGASIIEMKYKEDLGES
jgi:hypothetical protein